MPRGKIGKSLAQVIAEFDRDFPLEMAEARRQLRSEPMTLEVTDITHVVFQQEIERLRHDIERHIAIASEHATECERLRAELAEAQEKAIRFDLDSAGIERREQEATELVTLRAELAERKRDAERYRWLRGKLDPADIAILRIRSDPCDAVDAQVDASIDAALAAKE